MGGSPKWMVYNGQSFQNGWLRGTPVLGCQCYRPHPAVSASPFTKSSFAKRELEAMVMDELSISLCWSSLGIHIFRLMFVLSQPGYSLRYLWWNIMEPNIAKRLKIGSSFFSPLKYNLFGDFGGVYTTFFRHTPKKTGLGLQNIIYIYIYIHTYTHHVSIVSTIIFRLWFIINPRFVCCWIIAS